MWEKVIFIDYDVGSFGNSILSLLVTTSQSPLDALDFVSVLSSVGDAHKIRTLYKHSRFEYQIPSRIPVLAEYLTTSTKYVPIIGHSYGKINELMEQYPDANLVRIATDRHTFATTFLAGCSKFTGYPTVDTMSKFYDVSWPHFDHTECGAIECLSLNFHRYISTVDWKFYHGAIILSVKDIIDTMFQTVIALFEKKFNFVFDYCRVNNFVTQWMLANKCYIDRAQYIENIVSCIKTNTPMSLIDICLYEKALIIAFVCYDLELDIKQYPFNNSSSLQWDNTEEISNLIYNYKDFCHG